MRDQYGHDWTFEDRNNYRHWRCSFCSETATTAVGAPPPGRRCKKRKKQAERKERGVYQEFHKWVAFFPCVIARGCSSHVAGHHLKPIGRGGTDLDGEVPLCGVHHTEVEQIGRSRFESKYSISLGAESDRLLGKWNDRQGDLFDMPIAPLGLENPIA